MLVRDVMAEWPIAVHPSDTLRHAFLKLFGLRIQHLLVMDGGRVCGTLSYRDIQRAIPSLPFIPDFEELFLRMDDLKVQDVMLEDAITISPDTTLEAAREVFSRGTSPPSRWSTGRGWLGSWRKPTRGPPSRAARRHRPLPPRRAGPAVRRETPGRKPERLIQRPHLAARGYARAAVAPAMVRPAAENRHAGVGMSPGIKLGRHEVWQILLSVLAGWTLLACTLAGATDSLSAQTCRADHFLNAQSPRDRARSSLLCHKYGDL